MLLLCDVTADDNQGVKSGLLTAVHWSRTTLYWNKECARRARHASPRLTSMFRHSLADYFSIISTAVRNIFVSRCQVMVCRSSEWVEGSQNVHPAFLCATEEMWRWWPCCRHWSVWDCFSSDWSLRGRTAAAQSGGESDWRVFVLLWSHCFFLYISSK